MLLRLALAAVLVGAAASRAQAQAQDGPVNQPPGAEKLDNQAPETRRRLQAARLKTIKERPPSMWVGVSPNLLRDVTPEQLKAGRVALVLVRASARAPDGAMIRYPYIYSLRDVDTDRIRAVLLRQRGAPEDLGWGVVVLPAGRYVSTGAPIQLNAFLKADGTLVHKIRPPFGTAKVPADEAVKVEAGEVIYLGSEVDVFREKKPPAGSIEIHDESLAAEAYAKKELPAFAPQMKTRLLPSIAPVVLQ